MTTKKKQPNRATRRPSTSSARLLSDYESLPRDFQETVRLVVAALLDRAERDGKSLAGGGAR